MALTIASNIPLFSLSGNPIKVQVNTDNLLDYGSRRSFYNIILNVYDDSGYTPELIKSLSAEPDDDGNAWFDLASAFTDLEPTFNEELAWDDPVQADTGAVKKFYFTLAEGYGIPYVEQSESFTSGDYYVMPGGVSDWVIRELEDTSSTWYSQISASNVWLTNRPDNKRVKVAQPEQLRFIHLGSAAQTGKLLCERLLSTGSTELVELWEGTLQPYTAYSVLATREFCAGSGYRYSLWMEGESASLTNRATFEIDNAKPDNTRFIVFRNSLGGFDCLAITGKFLTEIEVQTNEFQSPVVTQLRDALEPGQERAMGIKYLTGAIGWQSSDEMEWLTELLISETRYLQIGTRFDSVIITPGRKAIASDGSEPRSIDLEMVVGVPDFFFLNQT